MDMTRRTVLAASGAAVAAGGAAQAQPQREKGPLVWMNMDQKELDDAYDQSVYAPNQPQLGKRRNANSALVRKRLGEPKRFAYGSTPIESMEVWTTSKPNAPVMVFVHGGAWRVGLAKEHCYAAELYVNAGAHYAVLDFINVDQAGGDLMPMAEQIRRAIAWVGKNAASFGGDPNRIYVSGHSSGAHLAGVTLVTDWAAFGAPADILKGAVLCSGMYDLKPARLSKRGAYVKFTDAMEDALSTQRHLARINCPVVVA
jgi:arylformamidase